MKRAAVLACIALMSNSSVFAAERDFLGILLSSATVNAEIVGIAKGAPADLAGLHPGDVITFVGKQQAVSPALFWALVINARHTGTPDIEISARRECTPINVRLAFAEEPDAAHPPQWTYEERLPKLPEPAVRPKEAVKHAKKARELKEKGDFKRAVEEYRQSIALWPWWDEWRYHDMAAAQRQIGDEAGAAATEARWPIARWSLERQFPLISWLGIQVRDANVPNGGARITGFNPGPAFNLPGWQLFTQHAIGEGDVIHVYDSLEIHSAEDLLCAAVDPQTVAEEGKKKLVALMQEGDGFAQSGRLREAVHAYTAALQAATTKITPKIVFTRVNGDNRLWTVTTSIRQDTKIAEIQQKLDDLDWRQKVAGCRALGTKTPMQGDARKYRVLAEDAVKEQRFQDAARYFASALDAQPCWPQGHFNLAMLDGELKAYAQAAVHMHRYLDLAPHARDADKAQDKIILWEEKAKTGAN